MSTQCTDHAYRGKSMDAARDLLDLQWEIVEVTSSGKDFVVQAHRWIVERPMAWYFRNRRRDYETFPT